MAVIVGTVIDSRTNDPISDATVLLIDQNQLAAQSRYVSVTVNGLYRFERLPASTFEMSVAHPDYTTYKSKSMITIPTANTRLDISVPLSRKRARVPRPPAPPAPPIPPPAPPPGPPVQFPDEIDVGQRQHPELGGERAWKQRVGNIPGETLGVKLGGELTIKQEKKEPDEARLGVIVRDDQGRGIGNAGVVVHETGQQSVTDGGGIAQFYVPVDRSYTVSVSHNDYHDSGATRTPRVQPRRGAVYIVQLNRKSGLGIIRGRVIDDDRKPVPKAKIKITGPTPVTVDTQGDGSFDSGGRLAPGNYKVKATKSGKSAQSDEIEIGANETKSVLLRLKGGGGAGGYFPIFTKEFWTNKETLVRLAVTVILWLIIYIGFYQPFFHATGLHNFIFDFIIPFLLMPFVLFFFIAPKFEQKPDVGPLVISIIATVIVLGILLFVAPSPFRARYFMFGIPTAVFLLTYSMAQRKDRSMGKTLLSVIGILAIVGGAMLIWGGVTTGKAFQIDTYLKVFDVLHLVGVPQESIDGFKDGVKSVLNFLQFKGIEPVKPEAKKIGGFEAIQLNFGSKFNNYALPTLFARMDYTLPVTVTNPNKFGTDLVVRDFKIADIYMFNGSTGNRIMCGGQTNTADEVEGSISLNDIPPEEERQATIDFRGRTINGSTSKEATVDCRNTTYGSRPSSLVNPLFSVKFRQPADVNEIEKCDDISTSNTGGLVNPDLGPPVTRDECKKNECITECSATVDQSNLNYGLPSQTAYPSGNTLDKDGTRFVSIDDTCECKVKKYYNILDEMCFLSSNKAQVSLKFSYGFNVQGKGEMTIAKTEDDAKIAPKPAITSSAGPLTVTTYFISNVHAAESKTLKTTKMFVQISNEGEGTATVNNVKIASASSEFAKPNNEIVLGGNGNKMLGNDVVKIDGCQPDAKGLGVDDESVTISCDVEVDDSVVKSKLSGAYITLPIIVDVDYVYAQTTSTDITVKKESIPPSITDTDQIEELKRQLEPLPYFCPPNMKIYNPDATVVRYPSQPSQGATQLSKFADYCNDKISKGDGACKNSEGGCKGDNECDQTVTSPAKLVCRDVGAEVKVCCSTTLSDADCKQNFETWKSTQ